MQPPKFVQPQNSTQLAAFQKTESDFLEINRKYLPSEVAQDFTMQLDHFVHLYGEYLKTKDEKCLSRAQVAHGRFLHAQEIAYISKAIGKSKTFLKKYQHQMSPDEYEKLEHLLTTAQSSLNSYHKTHDLPSLRAACQELLLRQKVTMMRLEMNTAHTYSDNQARNRFIETATSAASLIADAHEQAGMQQKVHELNQNWQRTIREIQLIHGDPELKVDAKLLKIRPLQDQLREHQEHVLKDLVQEGHPAQHLPRPGAKKAYFAGEGHELSPAQVPTPYRKAPLPAVKTKPAAEERFSRSTFTHLIKIGDNEELEKALRRMPEAQKKKFIHFELHSKDSIMTLAARIGDSHTIKLLLDHGMDPNHTGSNGVSPVQAAREHNHHEVSLMLSTKSGAKPAFAPAQTMPAKSSTLDNPALTREVPRRESFQSGATTRRNPLHNRAQGQAPTLPKRGSDHHQEEAGWLNVGPASSEDHPVEL